MTRIVYLPLVLCLQWLSGAYVAGFDGYYDEPRHYVTGLMLRDYIAGFHLAHPMQFAQNYYLHYPAVAFGHWPPVFYVLQAAWMMFLPVSHASILVLMAILTAATAALIHWCAAGRLSSIEAWMAGLLFVALPVTQMYAAMVMAEMPLALFSVAALIVMVRFLEKATTRVAVALGLAISVAVLAKPSAWALPPTLVLSILLLQDWKRLLSKHVWMAGAIVAVLCVPFSILTLSMVRAGMEGRSITWSRSRAAFSTYVSEFPEVLGIALLVLVLCGLVTKCLLPLYQRRPMDPFWAVMAAFIASVLVFHVVVPTTSEPRKILMTVPAVLLFAAGGVQWIATRFRTSRPVVVLLALGLFGALTFTIPHREPSWIPPVAGAVVSRPDLRMPVILVASQQPQGVEIDAEAAVIAQIASMEPQRLTRYVLRASKLLITGTLSGGPYHSLFETTAEQRSALDQVPVGLLIVHSVAGEPELPHQSLLRAMLKEYSSDWQQVYSATNRSGREATQIFRRTGDIAARPIRFQVQIVGGGLGLTIKTQ